VGVWFTLDEAIWVDGKMKWGLTPEEAKSMVEEGLITRDLADKHVQHWRDEDEQSRRYKAKLDAYFNERLEKLNKARRERTKTRIEDDDLIQESCHEAKKLKRENPRMTWEQIAARIGISRSQMFRWRARLRENATKRD
jgi:Homeodomain-like domain